MSELSEEEIIIKYLQEIIERAKKDNEYENNRYFKSIQGLLNLYKQEEEKNKELKKALLYMINQFAYDEKRNKQEDELLYTGGLSALEEAFDVLNIDEGIKRKDLWNMIQELLKE